MRILQTLAVLVLFYVHTVAVAAESNLKQIKENGVITIGVKTDYPPWGFIDSSGNKAGMEIDMARDIADRIGVDVELVAVETANRIQFLQRGKIDMILATMGVTEKRRRVVGIVEPPYYASGGNVLLPKGSGVSSWDDLRGKEICATQGANYNKRARRVHGMELLAFPGVSEALTTLQNGRCEGFLQSSALIAGQIGGSQKWEDFEMPLDIDKPTEWAMAVPKGQVDSKLGNMLSRTVREWHANGYLVDLERKWGLTPSNPYLLKMHEKYNK